LVFTAQRGLVQEKEAGQANCGQGRKSGDIVLEILYILAPCSEFIQKSETKF
jgi:hypothetical protein